jgi:hypothetical protein
MYSELRNFARFRDTTDSSPHFSDVWTDAQRSRSAFIQWFVFGVWQRFIDAKDDDQNRYYPRWSRLGGHPKRDDIRTRQPRGRRSMTFS